MLHFGNGEYSVILASIGFCDRKVRNRLVSFKQEGTAHPVVKFVSVNKSNDAESIR